MAGLIAHEWAGKTGGAEKVVEQMLAAFPDSDLFMLWADDPERFAVPAQESWLAKTPLRRHKALALPFMLPTWRGLPTKRRYDWLLASSHLFAHHARLGSKTSIRRVAYVHTPARYIWAPESDPRGRSAAVRLLAPFLRRFDRRRAQELDAIAANSHFISTRIRRAWGRDSQVIYPPVDVSRIVAVDDWKGDLSTSEHDLLKALPSDFVLGASRFTSHKRLDLVFRSAERADIAVVIAGRGPEEEALRRHARMLSVPAYVVSSPSDALLYSLYARASALVFPSVEDFGIVPVEAQALGTPVVCGPLGGQIETIVPGMSGIIAESFSPEDFGQATRKALELDEFDGEQLTRRFDNETFLRKIRSFVLSDGREDR